MKLSTISDFFVLFGVEFFVLLGVEYFGKNKTDAHVFNNCLKMQLISHVVYVVQCMCKLSHL